MIQLLIVDDEIHAVEGIKAALHWDELGVSNIFTANNIRQAKEIFEGHAVDILLCDIEMPQGNGLELLRWVRSNFPETKSIFLTCHSDFAYIKQAIQLESLDYILKPAPYSELEAVISRAIEKINIDKEMIKQSNYGKMCKEYFPDLTCCTDEDIQEQKWVKTIELPQSIVGKVKMYIKEHLDENLSRIDIADHFFINPDYLTRVFKKETGLTIMEYLSEERIKAAQKLLVQTDLSVSAVAAKLCYTNFSYFSKMFKKYTNMKPTDFKQNITMTIDKSRNSVTNKSLSE